MPLREDSDHDFWSQILLRLSSWCLVIVVSLPHGAMGLFAVCDYDISCSCSLTILEKRILKMVCQCRQITFNKCVACYTCCFGGDCH